MPSAPSASNPYESPRASDPRPVESASVSESLGLGLASVLIIICGVIYVLGALAALPLSILMYRTVTSDTEEFAQPSLYLDSALFALIYGLAFAVIGGLMIYAGWSMRKRRNYWICLVGAVVGCIPFPIPLPLVFLSLLPSLWALWRLSRPRVRAAFWLGY